jgi:PBSX family phage terminase large subunit
MHAVAEARKTYHARGAALSFWSCRDDECLLVGPAGSGKTRACLEKVHAALLKWPGSRALLIRKTRESLTETALKTYERDVAVDGCPPTSNNLRNVRQSYRYPNGSEFVVGGMDKASKIMSTEFDLCYVQEATELNENDWELLSTRLRNGVMPFQQIIADCNPDAPTHWLRKRCDDGRTREFISRHEDNPRFWDAEAKAPTPQGIPYFKKLDALTGVRKSRLRDGLWVAAEGLVWEFDPAVHLIDRFPIPDHWRRYRSIDFGFTNPTTVQWWAVDDDGRLYLYRELYATQTLVSDWAQEINRLSHGETIEDTIADHDAEGRATLHRLGIKTTPAKKAILEGIEMVAQRLRILEDGKPRLFVLRDSLVRRDPLLVEAKLPCCFAEEVGGYCWPKGQDGKPLKELPAPGPDHGADATRYICMHLDKKKITGTIR